MNEPYSSQSVESRISYYGWKVVGVALLANMVGFGLIYGYGIFFKPLAAEFGWSRSVTAGAFSAYAIIHTFLAFLFGRMVDKFGPRIIVAIAGFCLGLSMILMSYVTSIWQLYLFYGVFFSIGIAGMYTPLMTTVSQWFKEKRGLAIGMTAVGVGAASLVFSPLSAWLISSFGWRFSYIVLGIIAWVVFIPVVKFVRISPHKATKTEGEVKPVEGVSFSEAWRTRTFWAFCFTWMFFSLAVFSIMIHIVPLITDRGVSLVEAGVLAGLIGIGSIIGRIIAGFTSDKIGGKKVIIIAAIVQTVAIIWLLFSKELWMLYIFVVFFGFGSGGSAGVIAAFPAHYFGLKATGAIMGFGVILAGVGSAIGPYFGGYVFDVTQSYDYMIVVCIAASIGAVISAMLMRPLKKGRVE